MRLAFLRHGQPRRGETDPSLTSAGRRMAFETGGWLLTHGLRPSAIVHTATARTTQTAEEVGHHWPETARTLGEVSPELPGDWERLTDELITHWGDMATLVLVGHHPTVGLLLDLYGPPPVPVPRRNLAIALVLDGNPSAGWRLTLAWPGRPAL